jgi:hypothetical protein
MIEQHSKNSGRVKDIIIVMSDMIIQFKNNVASPIYRSVNDTTNLYNCVTVSNTDTLIFNM